MQPDTGQTQAQLREASQAPGSLPSISSREGSHLGLSQPTFPLLETLLLLCLVAHTCDPSTQEVEAGELLIV